MQSDEAFVTSFIRYGDADCIVRLFCREQGRVSAFYKNGMKSSTKRGSAIQAPAKARVDIQSRNNSDLYRLVEIDIAAQTYAWARSLRTLGFTSYLLEITELFLPEHEAAQQLFDALTAALTRLANENPSATVLRAYEIKLLSYCGYLPDLNEAVEGLDELALAAARNFCESDLENLPEVDEAILRNIARLFVQQLREHARQPLSSVEFLKNVGV